MTQTMRCGIPKTHSRHMFMYAREAVLCPGDELRSNMQDDLVERCLSLHKPHPPHDYNYLGDQWHCPGKQPPSEDNDVGMITTKETRSQALDYALRLADAIAKDSDRSPLLDYRTYVLETSVIIERYILTGSTEE